MREPRPITGAATPLFDRLLDDGINVRRPVSSSRALDLPALRESVRQDLSRLLNTRTTLHGSTARDLAGGTVLDYGIPTLTSISPHNDQQRIALAAEISKVVANFEPRLQDVKVIIQPDKRDPRLLIGVIYAQLVSGNVSEPVYFPLSLDDSGKKVDVTAP